MRRQMRRRPEHVHAEAVAGEHACLGSGRRLAHMTLQARRQQGSMLHAEIVKNRKLAPDEIIINLLTQ